MALAIVHLDSVDRDAVHFDLELGSNRWFVYAIGDAELEHEHGLALLSNPKHTSSLQGPVDPRARGRTRLSIPLQEFDRENRNMQVMSFRTRERVGPAISDVVKVPFGAFRLGQAASLSTAAGAPFAPASRGPRRGRVVPFSLVEAKGRQVYSEGMFWQALVGMLPQIIPAVAPLVGNLLGGLFGGGTGAGGAGAAGASAGAGPLGGLLQQVGELLKKPEGQQLVQQILRAVAGPQAQPGQGGGGAPSGAAPAPGGTQVVAPTQSLFRAGSRRYSRAQFIDGGILTGPALAGLLSSALPALMPLLQKVASPEMLNTLMTNASPEKTLAPVVDILMDPNRRQFERLWQHTPLVGPNPLPQLLLALEASARTPIPAFQALDSVVLAFEGLAQTSIHGTSRVVYRAGRDVTLALSVQTPKPIAQAELHWAVKRPDTLEVVAHGRERHANVSAGALPPLTLPAASLSRLAAPDDYLVEVALVWKAKSGKRVGTRRSTMLTLAGEFLFDRVQDATGEESDAEGALPLEPIPLSDVQQHREFWHKVWEGRLTQEARSRDVECKYHYALEAPEKAGWMETLQKRATRDGKPLLRLKSGTLFSLEQLNRLLTVVSDQPALAPEQLAALDSPDFRQRFSQAAVTGMTFRGRAGSRVALWVYPEVKLQRVVLKRASETDANGQVTAFEEVPVVFPMPVLAHFAGTRSEVS